MPDISDPGSTEAAESVVPQAEGATDLQDCDGYESLLDGGQVQVDSEPQGSIAPRAEIAAMLGLGLEDPSVFREVESDVARQFSALDLEELDAPLPHAAALEDLSLHHNDESPGYIPPRKTGIPTIDMSQIFVDRLRDNPSLEDSRLDSDTINHLLWEPPTELAKLSADDRLSIKLFLADTNGSEKIYKETRKAVLEHHPNDPILSHHSVKKKVAELTGIYPLTYDMCPKSCMAYTGPWEGLDRCKFCSEPRYDQDLLAQAKPVKKAHRMSDTYPIGPQVQARFRSPEGAQDMRHQQGEMGRIMRELEETEGELDRISDIIKGSDFWDAFQRGQISEDDLCLVFSMDDAQLYEHKASNVWIYIWILVDVSPGKRYKKKFILPGTIIPGPMKPKHADSFLFPGFHHVAALQCTGFWIWDAARKVKYVSRPWIVLGEADAVGAPDQTGYVAHHGKMGC
ncbi:hypothetical protein GSI_04686 [Ganoderma sinense ZZ0214-1]|uniref:Uncharacterized protein n=1 Tax=Ganoderma sinense ZZ0214-1 TaxID=1077348 RepID=A0A2G8SHJ4_9APHY|nr:hypothetical protein GSI_04686 [Ganoderma sinense ZZ0214-1]